MRIQTWAMVLWVILASHGPAAFAQLPNIHVEPFRKNNDGGGSRSSRQDEAPAAQPLAPSESEVAQAKSGALNDKGLEAYHANDFESAIDYFEEAHRLAPGDENIALSKS